VWGPEPIALGFIGAPLATAISFNLMAIASIVYGVFIVPSTAWHPVSRRSFTDLGILLRLGLAGIGLSFSRCHFPTFDTLWSLTGQTASAWWSWELIGRESFALGQLELIS
jgi:MATE family multidrug resistance protein